MTPLSPVRYKKSLLFILSMILLLAGGMIYLLYRPHTLFMFSWLESFGLENFFAQKQFNSSSIFLSFCIYSLPTGLWAVSALILFGIVWKNSKKTFLFYSLAFIFGNIAFEFMQLFGVIAGTFDVIDILVLAISLLVGILIYSFFLKGDFYES